VTALNDFLPFATASGANVVDNATWSGLAARSAGFSSGLASSAQFNKALRQATFIAAALAGWVAAEANDDVKDDGVLDNFQGQLTAALTAFVATLGYAPMNKVLGGSAQTMQNVTSSRALGTTYTNNTGRPIWISVNASSSSGNAFTAITITQGTSPAVTVQGSGSSSSAIATVCTAIIPDGATYSANVNIGTGTLGNWVELR